jgi:hypothetical protein
MIDPNPTDDKSDYRVTFLNLVLWHLGHLDEPDETLLEVLKSIEDYSESDAFITTTEDARYMADMRNQQSYDISNLQFEARVARIMARKEREKIRSDTDDELPW